MPTSPKLVARALHGSPLRRPLGGCLFLAGLLLLLGVALLGHLALWVLEPMGRIGIFAAAALLATGASLPILALLWWLDRRERESIYLFIGAVIWGAVISTGVSGIFNSLGFGFIALGLEAAAVTDAETLGTLLAAALVAPPVEEAAKGLAVLVLFWFLRAEFDNLRDGIIYGGLVGVGFNIAEYALYVMQGYAQTGTAPFADQLAGRFVFLGLNGHMLWSALCGAGIGLARQTRSGCVTLGAPLGGYAAATFGHALNNSVGVFLLAAILIAMGFDVEAGWDAIPPAATWVAAAMMNVLVQGIAYVALLVLLVLSARWERDVIRTFLADEVGGTVTHEEYGEIARDRILFGTRRARGMARQIAIAQNELAFRKWHVARDGGDPNADALVLAWREDIARLRAMS